jgi:hypothetical protein
MQNVKNFLQLFALAGGLRESRQGGAGGLPLREKFAKVDGMDGGYRHKNRIGLMMAIGRWLGRWG